MSEFQIIFLHVQYENSDSLKVLDVLFNANFAVGNLEPSVQ